MQAIKVGIISFTDPRDTGLALEREKYIESRHFKLKEFLYENNFDVVNPLEDIRQDWTDNFGIRTVDEVKSCLDSFRSEDIDCLIIGCWHWTEPHLAVSLVRDLNKPVALFNEGTPGWAGATHIGALGASIWEVAGNSHCLTHERIVGDMDNLIPWIYGTGASEKMKQSSLLLWGGSYCLRMDHLQDDISYLKSFLIGEVLSEGQYFLIKRAEDIIKNQSARINNFIAWLNQNNAKINYDDKMLTEPVFRTQAALYLASRDRLKELEDENITGISIKCQNELSVEYGITPCLLPAFLPYASDSEGAQPIIPAVCEGDLKGLLTCSMLLHLNPHVPPLFGDLKYVCDDYLIISNCGASSVYYAANSLDDSKVLPELSFSGQCQGNAGGAVGYHGKSGVITLARFMRIDGDYIMQMGVGKSLNIDENITKNIIWGTMWPHTAIDLGVKRDLFMKVAGSNHFSGMIGDWAQEITYFCRETGIPVVRIDNNDSLMDMYDSIGL